MSDEKERTMIGGEKKERESIYRTSHLNVPRKF